MVRLICFILCLLICQTTYAKQYSNRYYGIVEICFSFEDEQPIPRPAPAPAPAPNPSPYKCEKCKDTKWIIHGDGHKSPCPNCNSGEEPKNTVENKVTLSDDFKYVIINNKKYIRKAPMSGNGQWVGVDKWKVCYGRYCRIYTIDQNNLGLNLGDYNVY